MAASREGDDTELSPLPHGPDGMDNAAGGTVAVSLPEAGDADETGGATAVCFAISLCVSLICATAGPADSAVGPGFDAGLK